MEDVTIGLLHLNLTKTLDLVRNSRVAEAEDMLEEVCDILESYLKEGE